MFRVVSKEALFQEIMNCNSVAICDNEDLIAEIRNVNPRLYIKVYESACAHMFPNATFILTDDVNISLVKETFNGNANLYALEAEVVEEVPVLDETTTEFLDGIDFGESLIEEPVNEETQSVETESIDETILPTPEVFEVTEEMPLVVDESTEEVFENLPSVEVETVSEEVHTPTAEPYTGPVVEDDEVESPKQYEDKEFDNLIQCLEELTPDMKVAAKPEMVAKIHKARPDIDVSPIRKGGISLTEGMIVLLRLRTRIGRREARKIYPSSATLYMVTC